MLLDFLSDITHYINLGHHWLTTIPLFMVIIASIENGNKTRERMGSTLPGTLIDLCSKHYLFTRY